MRSALALAACLALLLPGCMGTSVATVSGQGYAAGSKTDAVDCGTKGRLAIGAQGSGSFSVKVTDGDGMTLFSKGSISAGQDGETHSLTGAAGTWRLTVSTGFGYAGQYAVTLAC